jgi:hypothetical protein
MSDIGGQIIGLTNQIANTVAKSYQMQAQNELGWLQIEAKRAITDTQKLIKDTPYTEQLNADVYKKGVVDRLRSYWSGKSNLMPQTIDQGSQYIENLLLDGEGEFATAIEQHNTGYYVNQTQQYATQQLATGDYDSVRERIDSDVQNGFYSPETAEKLIKSTLIPAANDAIKAYAAQTMSYSWAITGNDGLTEEQVKMLPDDVKNLRANALQGVSMLNLAERQSAAEQSKSIVATVQADQEAAFKVMNEQVQEGFTAKLFQGQLTLNEVYANRDKLSDVEVYDWAKRVKDFADEQESKRNGQKDNLFKTGENEFQLVLQRGRDYYKGVDYIEKNILPGGKLNPLKAGEYYKQLNDELKNPLMEGARAMFEQASRSVGGRAPTLDPYLADQGLAEISKATYQSISRGNDKLTAQDVQMMAKNWIETKGGQQVANRLEASLSPNVKAILFGSSDQGFQEADRVRVKLQQGLALGITGTPEIADQIERLKNIDVQTLNRELSTGQLSFFSNVLEKGSAPVVGVNKNGIPEIAYQMKNYNPIYSYKVGNVPYLSMRIYTDPVTGVNSIQIMDVQQSNAQRKEVWVPYSSLERRTANPANPTVRAVP